jgi:hypothetical protein
MAKRKKATRKAKTKRKKTLAKASTRRKTITKKRTKTARKKTAKTPPLQGASPKKARPTVVKPAPVGKQAQPEAVRLASPRAAKPVPSEERIGVVTHYFSHPAVAIIQLESGTLRIGDMIHIRGHTTDFTQKVESLEIKHAPATEVGPKDDFGLKVVEHVREHDVVFKVRS